LDPNFYFAMELDTDGTLRSMFWTDSRSRNEYFIFGDVIVFDITYKTNKFMMPFALFTGSESINAFFDGFVNSNTPLHEFVEQYDMALQSRRQAKEREDYMTMNSKAVLIVQSLMEKSAGDCYTRVMFKLFQEEFKSIIDCWHQKVSKCGTIITYSVGLRCDLCDCAKFETGGYLCKHILHIMVKKHLIVIPDRYILKRWTIGARYLLDGGVSVSEA
ncbi:LOW QUALITY PROTEIN: hypothetical protein CFOL_v3_16121, partial [Cephalotus follicularis]